MITYRGWRLSFTGGTWVGRCNGQRVRRRSYLLLICHIDDMED